QKDKLIGLIQERYGYAREQAEQEVERRLQEYGDKTGGAGGRITAKGREEWGACRKKGNQAATRVRAEGERTGRGKRGEGAARRQDGHNCDQSSGPVRIGEHLFAREEIRLSGRRLQGFGSSLPAAVTIGRSWFWLFARRTSPSSARTERG